MLKDVKKSAHVGQQVFRSQQKVCKKLAGRLIKDFTSQLQKYMHCTHIFHIHTTTNPLYHRLINYIDTKAFVCFSLKLGLVNYKNNVDFDSSDFCSYSLL